MSEPHSTAQIEQLEADNARLRRLLAGQGVGAELRHQVRNTLGTVRALIRRSAEIDGTVDDYAAHLEGRLDAVLRVQSTLTRGSIAGADLYSLLSSELLACLAQEGKQVRIEGPDVHLQPKAAEPLSLAFHELATNSVKFGALGVPDGRIEVNWRVLDASSTLPTLAFTWKESGGPAIAIQPGRRGFGTELLERMLNYQLGTETDLTFASEGLHCRIRLPLSPDIGSLVPTPRHESDT